MPRTSDDQFEPVAAGGFRVRLAGQDYRLRRPNIGEQRRYVEVLEQLSTEQKAAREADDYEPDYFEGAILDWWRTVFRELDTGKLEGQLPDDAGEFPPWIFAGDLIAETRAHWSSVPWGPGGSPSQRTMKAAQEAQATTARLIDAAARLQPPT